MASPNPDGPKGPLDGVRVLDLSRVWAGPHCTRILADLGAEVIHISGRGLVGRRTVTRETAKAIGIYPDNEPGERHWNRHVLNNDMLRNKYDITLELNTERGVALFKRLVAIGDIVIENYSPRVMPNLGIDYPVLKDINPAIIYCSMPGYGPEGPFQHFVSYGTTIDPHSGLASRMGYPGEEPYMSGNAYPDPASGMFATGAIMTALFNKARTGKGQYISLAQAESGAALTGEASLGYQLTGKVPPRIGNGHLRKAPHGAYPCVGEDKWVAISVGSDTQWSSFRDVMAKPDWANEDRYSTVGGRLENRAELDSKVAEWTRERNAYDVMRQLQATGIAAGVVVNADELIHDENLNERGFYWKFDHPEAGVHTHAGQPIRLSETPARHYRPAPTLGQHHPYVLGELLGLSDEEITDLEETGIIGYEPLVREV
ncbi:MAG: CoA transferase [Chloroflexi bacterium]|mgnify:CR=1 FL=1|nr:CoA transferase [Chloroflexota bacterium]MBT4074812.1 CoA transferase [Chloroflexota bacterium]MBT4514706.1 CoA transferase [Chloroflexota bacterium]MBT6682692.1 CoA transferase [Chloroflexota bacterium]